MTPLRARLMNPPNAVPDTGINMKNGAPILRIVRPFQPSRWKTPTLTQVWEVTPYPLPAFLATPLPPRQPVAPIPPGYLKPKATAILIINETCVAWGLAQYRLLSHLRFVEIVKPRQAAMAIMRRITPLSFPQIGKFFGGRDHSTIVHATARWPTTSPSSIRSSTTSLLAEWVRALKGRPGSMSGLPWLDSLPCPPSKNRKMGRLGNNTPAVIKWAAQADLAWVARENRTIARHCAIVGKVPG